MASVHLTALWSAMASIRRSLELEHLQTSNCYQQMLRTDSALETLSSLRGNMELTLQSQAVSEGEPLSDEAATECDVITQSLSILEELVEIVETQQAAARHLHQLRARALRKEDIGIMDMPAEVLSAIFQNFQPPLDFSTISPSSYEYDEAADVETIKSIRLTCRWFCQNSSHLLIAGLRVSPDRASLDRLKSVSSHPEIWTGERVLDIDLRYYSAQMAGDFRAFATLRLQYLKTSLSFLETWLNSADSHFLKKQEPPISREQYLKQRPDFLPRGMLILSAINGRRQLRRVRSKWGSLIDRLRKGNSVQGSAQPDAAIRALQRGHKRYQELYQEQQRLIQDGSFARAVAETAAASRSKIWLYMSDGRRSTPESDLHQLAKSNFLSFIEPHHQDHALSYIAQPDSWWHSAGYDNPEELPHSLLYEIPLAMRMVETKLAKLEVRMDYPAHMLDLSMSDEQLSSFEKATKDLETFIFSPIPEHDDPWADDEDLRGLYAYLRAAMGRSIVPNFHLDLYVGTEKIDDAQPPIGPLVSGSTSSNWHGLKSAVLANFDVGIEDLKTLTDMLEPGTKLRLMNTDLKSGTWAEALDCLRSKVSQDSDSWLINPSGAECVGMTTNEYQEIFHSGLRPWEEINGGGVGSRATQYIRSVEGVENPLLRHNTG
ncbi:hypothetical protein KVR01_000186 [Diaporthe batatas]|uniref:uncharacterized protein n=1 Tax=Diaporthe batatas TaxID=748121 RepID=UPI001D0382C7|nr:uncharacterized protein KVR01_000186 [Diaporthe batatas]KAG8169441.1 hypothetical protein KVR01_000186 [Diaporthe batatas]